MLLVAIKLLRDALLIFNNAVFWGDVKSACDHFVFEHKITPLDKRQFIIKEQHMTRAKSIQWRNLGQYAFGRIFIKRRLTCPKIRVISRYSAKRC